MVHVHAALALREERLRSEAATAVEEIEELTENWAKDLPEVFDELVSDVKQLIGEEVSVIQSALSSATASAVEAVDATVQKVEDAYTESVAPYVDPALHSVGVAVGEINLALTSDLLVGPYVTLAEQTAAVLIEGAKTYHLSEEEVETNFSSI
eukprot:gene28837-35772_t